MLYQPTKQWKCLQFRKYQYQNRRAKDTLERLSSETGIIVDGTVKRALQEQGFSFNDSVNNKSKYVPEAMFEALDKYFEEQTQAFDELIYQQAYNLTVKAFVDKSCLISQNPLDEHLRESVKLEKSSGAPEFSDKASAFDKDLRRAKKWVEGGKAAEPCVAYHRVQHGDEGPKRRLVWGYPLSVTLVESTFARPLINYYMERRTPMPIGQHRYKVYSRMVKITNGAVKYGFDFSKFDATISAKLIAMAFSVLAKQFDWNNSDRKSWDQVVNYFIHTPILMPDGFVYQKHRGVPSGSYFTQLIDSVVNYFLIQYATILLNGFGVSKERVLVLGDDSFFSLPMFVPVEQYQVVFAEMGMNLNVLKTNLTEGGQSPEFLGHTWKKGLVDRDSFCTAIRMVYPERHSKEKDGRVRVLSRIYPYVADSLTAARIIASYSYFGGTPATYRRAGEIISVQTGWREYLDTVTEGFDEKSYLELGYIGILK